MQIARREKRLDPIKTNLELPPRWHLPTASWLQQNRIIQPSHRAGSPPDIDKPKQSKPLLPARRTESP